jgi:hypothetical protein
MSLAGDQLQRMTAIVIEGIAPSARFPQTPLKTITYEFQPSRQQGFAPKPPLAPELDGLHQNYPTFVGRRLRRTGNRLPAPIGAASVA